jgi:hypothetical protein
VPWWHFAIWEGCMKKQKKWPFVLVGIVTLASFLWFAGTEINKSFIASSSTELVIQANFGVKLSPPIKSEKLFNNAGGFPMSGIMIEKLTYANNADAIGTGSIDWIENQVDALTVLGNLKTIDQINTEMKNEIESLIKMESKVKYFYKKDGQDELLLINLGSSNEVIVIELIF